MRAMTLVPNSAMSTHTHEMPMKSVQRAKSPSQPKANRMALPSCHGTHGQHAHQDEYPDERTDGGAVLAKDVVTGDDVVGKTFAKADLADEIRENEGKRERDGDGDAAELAARVEGDDTAAHEFGEA